LWRMFHPWRIAWICIRLLSRLCRCKHNSCLQMKAKHTQFTKKLVQHLFSGDRAISSWGDKLYWHPLQL
jgi:hypothetical protein